MVDEMTTQALSAAVQTRQMMTRGFLSLIEQHGDEIQGRLEAALAGVSARALLGAHGHAVRRAMETLAAADVALTLEAEDDKQYRDARDLASERLRAVLGDVRGLMDAAYGPSILAEYGLEGELARSPELLHVLAERVVGSLRAKPTMARSPYGFDLDLGLLADKIETELVPLALAMEDIRREVRELQEALRARNDAMAQFDRVKESCARCLASYFELSGRPDLAMLLAR